MFRLPGCTSCYGSPGGSKTHKPSNKRVNEPNEDKTVPAELDTQEDRDSPHPYQSGNLKHINTGIAHIPTRVAI